MSMALRNRLIGLVLAGAIYVVDQLLKHWVTVTQGIDRIGDYREILPFFDLRFTQNFGVSLGMFTADTQEGRWMLVGFTALIALVVLVWLLRERLLGEILGLAMILGGALGNIKDRFSVGYVIDYADLHFGEFRPFLIFNLADAAITIGVVILLARALFMREKADPVQSDTAEAAAVETD